MKVRSNYYTNNGGKEENALRMLTGAPIYTYNVTAMTDNAIWSVIKGGAELDFVMTIDTPGRNGADDSPNAQSS